MAKINIPQPGGQDLSQTIKENGLLDTQTLADLNFFSRNAYALSEKIAVDGSLLNLEEDLTGEGQDHFFIIDESNLMSLNSPLAFYLPTLKRHGILTYQVQNGDTIGKIAAKFGVSLNTILWANNLKSGTLIKPGQQLVILPVSGVRHIVQKGETIALIAKKYKADEQEIIAFNNLNNAKGLIEGQELIIPHGQITTKNSSYSSAASLAGLKPMTIDISSWPNLKGFYALPVAGGYNKGIFHYYNAVDFINSCGTPIYASANGLVLEAKTGWNLGYGNYIKIQHYNGTMTVYGHLGNLYVKEGDKVTQGQTIGTMSDTGNANGCHLHFEVRGAQNPFVLKK